MSTLTVTVAGRSIPASRRAVHDALATPWSDAQPPPRHRLPRATGYPSLALVELARIR